MAAGAALALGSNFIAVVLGLFVGSVFTTLAPTYALIGIGVTQLIWLGPLYWHFRKSAETESAKGVLLGAGLTLLLNGACWGILLLI